MSGFTVHSLPEGANRRVATLGVSQTFEQYDPVQLVTQQLIASPMDATDVLDSEMIGFANEPATGIHPGSRTGAANGFGAAEHDIRTYIPAKTDGLLMRTRNYWTTPGTQIAKPGTLVGTLHMITAEVANVLWGIDDTTGAPGTDATAFIELVLDDNMVPVNADNTTAAGEGWLVFRMIGTMQGDIIVGTP